MKYQLGYMDQYPIEASGSIIENNPMYKVTFKDNIDKDKLLNSLTKALDKFVIFKTKVMFHKNYYLETNNNEVLIYNFDELNRPKTFGKNTNGYPWRLSYYQNELCFEWLHGVSDGVGTWGFLKEILCNYYNVDSNYDFNDKLLELGLEPFMNKKEKGENFEIDKTGFSFKKFKKIKNRGYETDLHYLTCDTNEIIKLRKEMGCTFSPIITCLYSKAINNLLDKKIKNKDVACNIVLDLRRSLKYETIHNCVDYKRITYLDKFNELSLKETLAIYQSKLNNSRLYPNVVKALTERINTFKLYHIFKTKNMLKLCVKLFGKVLKDQDCNFVFTYPGRLELPSGVNENIQNVEFKVWHDFGECIISAVDYYGKFNLNISENFENKEVVNEFIRLSKEYGINWKIEKETIFTQSHFEE